MFLNNASSMNQVYECGVVITGLLGKWLAKDITGIITVNCCSQLPDKSAISKTAKVSCSNFLGVKYLAAIGAAPSNKKFGTRGDSRRHVSIRSQGHVPERQGRENTVTSVFFGNHFTLGKQTCPRNLARRIGPG